MKGINERENINAVCILVLYIVSIVVQISQKIYRNNNKQYAKNEKVIFLLISQGSEGNSFFSHEIIACKVIVNKINELSINIKA